ncbi:hypothetical protein IFM89_026280 [Coptis chinensis]|uniref:Uncharacterized protein n=1 Tax=Coptis chinensis TaxID=261450 RepID=A0A835IV46_9MAGN|nr:hypothetical protein IFM89_026280 [Coptis chinensis]
MINKTYVCIFYVLAAEALALPLLNPYLQKNASFSHGVNFAVAGSTSLSKSVLLQNRIVQPATNSSLSVQFNWFKNHLQTLCSFKTECAHILKNALFMVGEIGGNDFNYAFLQRKTLDEARSLVPHVVHQVVDIADVSISNHLVKLT